MSKTEDYGWETQAPESSNYINPAIRALVADAAPRDVLDAGCGNGALAAELAQDGYAVTGIDGDAGGIRIARTRVRTQ